VLGIDIIDSHLALARTRFGHLAPRLAFERDDLFSISSPDHCFDLTVCRHVLHSIPHADRVIAELVRVTRPGGYLHLIAEDHGVLHFERGALDPLQFWNVMPDEFGATTGTDLFIGRHAFGLLAAIGLDEVTVHYTHRVAAWWLP
jgi:ubiquinone/menaquinone biosynthesis C-methylase UbiE